MTDGAWYCLICTDTGAGPKFDREAEKHTQATGHGTTTSLTDGPFAKARTA